MKRLSSFSIRRALASVAALACLAGSPAAGQTAGGSGDGLPLVEVDASWPQPLPNQWLLGQVSGTAIGPQDHLWILHRPATLGEDRRLAAPPVIEFDTQGNVIRAWGGQVLDRTGRLRSMGSLSTTGAMSGSAASPVKTTDAFLNSPQMESCS